MQRRYDVRHGQFIQIGTAPVDEQEALVAQVGDHGRHVVRDHAQQLFALPHGFLRLLALGHIAGRDGDAVIAQPDRYEPRVGDTVLDFADHYGCSVLPAHCC